MSENYIVINGKKAELTEDQLKALGINVENKSPFERVGAGERYYSLTANGEVCTFTEDGCAGDARFFFSGNYCTDKPLMEQRAMQETLNRLLWRFSCENGELKNPWDNCSNHFYISRFEGEYAVYRHWVTKVAAGVIYFPSEEIAMRAIEEIVIPFMKEHPNFVW